MHQFEKTAKCTPNNQVFLTHLTPNIFDLRQRVIETNKDSLSKYFTWLSSDYCIKKSNQLNLEQLKTKFDKGQGVYFAILERTKSLEQPIYLGEIFIDAFYYDQSIANVFYWIAQEHQNRGFATQALLLLKDWAQKNTSLKKLLIQVKENNHASHAVAIKNGAILSETISDYPLDDGTSCLIYCYHLPLK